MELMKGTRNKRKIICETTGEIVYSYKSYLMTKYWAGIVNDLREESCLICGSPNTSIHHLNYKRLGKEKPDDLICLCNMHHMKVHKIRKDGTKRGTLPKTKRKKRLKHNKDLEYTIKEENGMKIKVYEGSHYRKQ